MRFEKGSEFWEARVEGKKLVRRSGRLDAKGRSATRALPTRIAARHALREAIEEKLAEGFVAVGDEAPEAPVEPHDAELDALLERDPGNPETALVYADWLQARGVARGEVMMIQHAALRAKGAEARRLRDELARVLAVHSEVLLGDLGEVENLFELKWRLGFVSEARIIADRSKRVKTVVAKLWKNPNQSRLLADLVRDFLALRSARFVESLTLESIGGRDFSEVLGHLAAQAPRTLGAITIPTTQYLEASLGVLGTVDMERGGMLRRRLGEYADAGIELGTVPLSLPSLRELVIEPPIAFTDEVPGLALLAESAMPALEVLALDCSARRAHVDHLRPLLRAGAHPKLRELTLRGARFAKALAVELLYSPLIEQLETVDLAYGTVDDAVAADVEAAKAKLPRLRRFVIHSTGVTRPAAERLRAAGLEVELPPVRTSSELTYERVRELCEDERVEAAARELADERIWREVGRDKFRIFGTVLAGGMYNVVAYPEKATTSCNCLSRKQPCKHGIALMFLAVDSDVPETPKPRWLYG